MRKISKFVCNQLDISKLLFFFINNRWRDIFIEETIVLSLETITSDWLISFSNVALCLYTVNAKFSTDSCHNPNTAVLHSSQPLTLLQEKLLYKWILLNFSRSVRNLSLISSRSSEILSHVLNRKKKKNLQWNQCQ